MTDTTAKLVFGSMLHSIGKVVCRAEEGNFTEEEAGRRYLQNELGITDPYILECSGDDSTGGLGGIVCLASQIAAGAGQKEKTLPTQNLAEKSSISASTGHMQKGRTKGRKKGRHKIKNQSGQPAQNTSGREGISGGGLNISSTDDRPLMPLQPVFDILNGNQTTSFYLPQSAAFPMPNINYPLVMRQNYTRGQYKAILRAITTCLREIQYNNNGISALLETMEQNLSYVPAFTAIGQRADIPLYDHMKLTAAMAICIADWLEEDTGNEIEHLTTNNNMMQDDQNSNSLASGQSLEKHDNNSRSDLQNVSQGMQLERRMTGAGTNSLLPLYSDKNFFLLASMDISGIQKFIYTINTENALRTLRARSFYLDILMEHIVDELLEKEGCSRANLIYSGGGHCYMLLPNTQEARGIFDQYLSELDAWFLENFQIQLYIAGGYAPCSAASLMNQPQGSYEEIFHQISARISEQKSHRYSAAQILALNSLPVKDYTRECKVCRNIHRVDSDGLCPTCAALQRLSRNILYYRYFSVVRRQIADAMPLPGGCSLVADLDAGHLEERMENDPDFVRAYSKNESYHGRYYGARNVTTIWTGDYTTGETFEELAQKSKGIRRIAVLRADVDNLGQTFVSGFRNEADHNQYVSLTRTAVLSRQLSLFFKFYINQILAKPSYELEMNGIETCESGTGRSGTDPGKDPGKDSGEKEMPAAKTHLSDAGHKAAETIAVQEPPAVRAHPRDAAIVYSGGDDLFIVGAWNDVVALTVDIQHAFARYTENTLTISAGIGLYEDSYPISVIAKEVEHEVDESKDLPGKNAVTLLEDGCFHKGNVEHSDSSRIEENRKAERLASNGRIKEAHRSDRQGGIQAEEINSLRISDGTYHWDEFTDSVVGEKYKVIRDFLRDVPERGNAFLYHLLELIRHREDRLNFARYVYLLSRMEPDAEAPAQQKEAYRNFSKCMVEWIGNEQDCRELKTAMELYVYLHRQADPQG